MLRFGIIGTNYITDWFMEGISEVQGAAATAVCSRSSERGDAFAAKYGIPHVFRSPVEMAACGDVDAIYVASPNCLHEEQALLAAKAGKHILVEKPAAPDRTAFIRMRNAAKANGIVMLEAMRPAHMESREAIRGQISCIGPIHRATLGYCQYSSRYDKFKNGIIENAFDPALSNCGLLDLGIYCVNLQLDLFGFPDSIQIASNKLANGFDAQGSLLLRYPGMVADIQYSKIADGRNASEIQGEKGSLLIDAVGNPKHVRTVFRDGHEKPIEFTIPPDPHGMSSEIRAFLAMVQKGSGQEQHLDLTEESLRLTDMARKLAGIDFKALS